MDTDGSEGQSAGELVEVVVIMHWIMPQYTGGLLATWLNYEGKSENQVHYFIVTNNLT
jgi:hypothetical protein